MQDAHDIQLSLGVFGGGAESVARQKLLYACLAACAQSRFESVCPSQELEVAWPAVFVCRAGGAQQRRQAVQARAEMHVLEVASRKRQEEARQAKSRDEHAACQGVQAGVGRPTGGCVGKGGQVTLLPWRSVLSALIFIVAC